MADITLLVDGLLSGTGIRDAIEEGYCEAASLKFGDTALFGSDPDNGATPTAHAGKKQKALAQPCGDEPVPIAASRTSGTTRVSRERRCTRCSGSAMFQASPTRSSATMRA